MRRSLFDPTVSTIIIIVFLLIVALPLGLAYWYLRMYLYILGDIIMSVVGLIIVILLIALTGWAFKKWQRTPDIIPVTKDGVYVMYHGKIISLRPLTAGIELNTGRIPTVTHIPVSLEYLANRDTGIQSTVKDQPDYWEDVDDVDFDLPTLEELEKKPDTVVFNDATTDETLPTTEEYWYEAAVEAFDNKENPAQGWRSMKDAIGCTEHQARKIVKRIKTERGIA